MVSVDKPDTYQSPYTSTFRILHDDPDARALHEAAIVLDHVGRRAARVGASEHELLEEGDFLLDVGDIVVFGVEIDDFECDDVACRDVFSPVHCAVRALAYDFEFLRRSAALRGEDAPGRACPGRRLCAARGVRRGSALPTGASCVVLATRKKRSTIGYAVGNLRSRTSHPPPPPAALLPSFPYNRPPPFLPSPLHHAGSVAGPRASGHPARPLAATRRPPAAPLDPAHALPAPFPRLAPRPRTRPARGCIHAQQRIVPRPPKRLRRSPALQSGPSLCRSHRRRDAQGRL